VSSNNYQLEVIKTANKLPRIRIKFKDGEYYNNSTFSVLSEPLDIDAMQKWTIENECGWRTSYDTFKFRNEEQLLMFVLRWA